ncbi:glycoside hydrolase family 43 protein [Amycolatopsis minnesotensis]|uniref:Glycoside hydrolase family 43 protein n=1 Tax=Amycolatopsis minnesotensis TaxID=337894 RepID=A0ABN2QFB8_9PSEU
MRPRLIAVVAVLVFAQAVPAVASGRAAAPVLLLAQNFADPDVVRTDAGYVGFSTSSGAGNVPYAVSAAPGSGWAVKGDALPNPPRWATPGGFWAPDVARRADGGFVLYFSATVAASGQMCVGAATSGDPAGPYHPAGDAALVCVPGDSGDIDPQTFVDGDGRRYLLYKSNGARTGSPAAIWLQELEADALTLKGPRTELLRADLAAEKSVVEAPSMVKRQDGYTLFYSADTFQSSGYHTSYANAPALTGPFVKSDAPLLGTRPGLDGPGGADVVDGHLFFHGWLDPGHTSRGLYTLPLSFDGERPVAG